MPSWKKSRCADLSNSRRVLARGREKDTRERYWKSEDNIRGLGERREYSRNGNADGEGQANAHS